ncbi:MAG: hypothetical protein CML24_02065 [Rhizobiales bacterium]|nr:hypothetical protein [Hyphomicrobiales bacterium]
MRAGVRQRAKFGLEPSHCAGHLDERQQSFDLTNPHGNQVDGSVGERSSCIVVEMEERLTAWGLPR